MVEKKLHEMEPGEKSGSTHEITQAVIENEVRIQCELYDRSEDESHLWRAWRTARAAGIISPACLEWLMPRLDKLAAAPNNEKRAEQREERTSRLLEYYREVAGMEQRLPGSAESLKECRKRVADRHDTSEGVINQLVLKFEGRGQRGKDKPGTL